MNPIQPENAGFRAFLCSSSNHRPHYLNCSSGDHATRSEQSVVIFRSLHQFHRVDLNVPVLSSLWYRDTHFQTVSGRFSCHMAPSITCPVIAHVGRELSELDLRAVCSLADCSRPDEKYRLSIVKELKKMRKNAENRTSVLKEANLLALSSLPYMIEIPEAKLFFSNLAKQSMRKVPESKNPEDVENTYERTDIGISSQSWDRKFR
jgi:hypothetical protein